MHGALIPQPNLFCRGVPIVEDTSARAKPNGSSAPVGLNKEELSANGTKRAREEDTADTDFADAKKTKVDAVDEGS